MMFSKKIAPRHTQTSVHTALPLDPSVCHSVVVDTRSIASRGEQWKLHDFVERIREEKRMWHSSCLFVWGALCTAISSPKGWNIFFSAWQSAFQQISRQEKPHLCYELEVPGFCLGRHSLEDFCNPDIISVFLSGAQSLEMPHCHEAKKISC